jgi:hypothetical protein
MFKSLQITRQKNCNYSAGTFNEIENKTHIPLRQQVKKSQLQHVVSTNTASSPPALDLKF